MKELEYRELNQRLRKLEQSMPNEFLLGIYTDLVRQHINVLKDLVYNRISREDFEYQIRLETDVRILEKNLTQLTEILSRSSTDQLKSDMEEINLATGN